MPVVTAPPLTRRQRQVLDYLYAYTLEHGHQPSYREILALSGTTSNNTATGYLKALQRKGYIGMAAAGSGTWRSRAVEFRLWPDGEPFLGFARPPLESVTTLKVS